MSGCGFQIPGSQPASDAVIIEDAAVDAHVIDAPDATILPIDAVMIDASLCPSAPVVVSPMSDWEISTDGTTWTAVTLPSTNWPCDNCTRYFRTTVCGQPEGVTFRFASDNRARMRINGAIAYDEYWIAGYCTDQLCCSRCCDTTENCTARLSGEKALDDDGLAMFTTSSTNTITWEVSEEIGGSGFHSLMTIEY